MKSISSLYKIGHGPSSSHTMGPEYACDYVLNKYKDIKEINITLYGSLALTGKGHLTDVIINKKLSGLKHTIVFDYKTYLKHPVGMRFEIYTNNTDNYFEETIYSVGGGTIEIEGLKKQVEKDYYPFKSFDEIKIFSALNRKSLCDIVYEFDKPDIKSYLETVYKRMTRAIEKGLEKDGELPGGLHVRRKAKQLFNAPIDDFKLREISAYAYATSEQNAGGGVIVTAPTCGASGVLPSLLYYYEMHERISKSKIIDALAVAGLVGNIIKTNASISGAYAGCQSEVGSATAMAAAAVAFLRGYSIEEIEYAAEIALEHQLGLTCDPVNGLVQIPCIERNAVAALRAYDAASLAHVLDGTRTVSLDTVIKTMFETGKDLNKKYKETAKGGLAKNYICM